MSRRFAISLAGVGLVLGVFSAGAFVTNTADVRAAARPATADVPTGKTGYVNMAKIIHNSRSAKARTSGLNEERVAASKDLLALRERYLAKQREHNTLTTSEAKEAVAREMVELGKQIESAERDVTRLVQARADKVVVALYGEIRSAVADTAKRHGLAAVHGFAGNPNTADPREMEIILRPTFLQPLYFADGVDLTDEVLATLDERFQAAGR